MQTYGSARGSCSFRISREEEEGGGRARGEGGSLRFRNRAGEKTEAQEVNPTRQRITRDPCARRFRGPLGAAMAPVSVDHIPANERS